MRGSPGLMFVLFAGCTAEILGPPRRPEPEPPGPRVREELTAWPTAARRLSRLEQDNALRDLLGEPGRPAWAALPEDTYTPFDNDYTTQSASAALIDGLDTIAESAAAAALADPARRARVVPCAASGPGDTGCFRDFIAQFGRRALRRPLSADEIDRYAELQSYAVEAGDFDFGVQLVMRAMLQHPEFLYRVELAGAGPLSPYEIASRLSFLIWGSIPDDALLDDARAGVLATREGRRAAAARMLLDPRAADRWAQFHAFWLGYFRLPHSAELSDAMRAESKALVQRVAFGADADYRTLFTSSETFIGDLLADQYGLARPGSAQWVGYAQTGRRGILSHGSVLSAFAKFTDTSPTQRGIFIRTRLLCGVVAPPPSNVSADAPPPPAGSRCKADRYAAHRSNPACASCHALIDPIGFGLERYDREGRYRTVEADAPECAISGDGATPELGAFNGPAELGEKLVASGLLEPCLTREVYRFAVGRREGAADLANIAELSARLGEGGRHFTDLLLELVASDAFANAPPQGGG